MADYQSYEGNYAAPAPAVDAGVSSVPPQQGGADSAASFTQAIPSALKHGNFILRAVQLLCDIIVMGCAASVSFGPFNGPFRSFILFVSATAFILDIFFLVSYKFGDRFPPALTALLPKIELAVSALWALFYFAGGIAYAVSVNDMGVGTNKTNAVAAFSIFNWIFWSGSAFFAFRRMRADGSQPSMTYNDL